MQRQIASIAPPKMRVSYTVFTHLLDANNRTRGQKDSIPLPREALTTSWLPGEALVDEYELFVDPDAPVGTCTIEIGMYDSNSEHRLRAAMDGIRLDGDRLLLGEIQVIQ